MNRSFRLAVVSDIHYAGPREQAEGDDYEHRVIQNPLLRFALRQYRRYVWLRYPLQQNGLLDRFLTEVPDVNYAIGNGDYTCNTAAVGVSAEPAFESVQMCLAKLRKKFSSQLLLTLGDHELGKLRLMGTRGGLRLKSWQRATQELGISPFWKLEIGHYVLSGCAATLIALPLFGPDMLADEKSEWEKLRAAHLAELRSAFTALQPQQRVLFFCHDPSALPFLWRDEIIQPKLNQIERTIIGHLHSNLYLQTSRILSGMPRIRFMGHSLHRMSAAVQEARYWKPFRVLLCPALAGIEMLNDGGYFIVTLDPAAKAPARFEFQPMKRKRWQ